MLAHGIERPAPSGTRMMREQEEKPITITQADIEEANRLSLHCPICAGAVERHVDGQQAAPLLCTACGTLYHSACWEQNGGKCAILGCESRSFRRYGELDLGPALRIEQRDIQAAQPYPPATAPLGVPGAGTKRLKDNERRMQREVQRRFRLRDFFEGLLRAIKLWPSDPS